MRTFLNLVPGNVVEKAGNRYVISNPLDMGTILAKCEQSGKSEVLSIGDITPVAALTEAEQSEHLELSLIDECDWSEAEGWHGKLRTLLSKKRRTAIEVKALADDIGVHISTVYRKLALLETTGRVSGLVASKPTGGKGKSRLRSEVEVVIKATIDEFHFNKEKKKRTNIETIEEIKSRLQNANLPVPHALTIRSRIADAVGERKRRHLAEISNFDATQTAGQALGADYPLAIVQIDHTLLDIMVVDDVYRLDCGRPWITLAIDVFSRMVVGFYISLDPPGNTGTGQCIAHAMLEKETWLAELDIKIPWPCWGLIDKIHADNAGEFRGKMLRRACREYGIDLEWRPVKKPRYGSHIERLLGTLLKEVHRLPGSTESNPEKRGEYDSGSRAVMTVRELEKWFALEVVGVYNQSFHTSLNTTPIKQFERGIFGFEGFLGRGYPMRINDADRLRLDLLPAFDRTVQPDGVMIDNISYHSGVLKRWIHAKDLEHPKYLRKFIFKRHPRNIQAIYFYDPELKQYFSVPYRDLSHPAMSIWELRRVRKYLSDKGMKDVDERTIFQALAEMRQLTEDCTQRTKKARRDQQRQRMSTDAPLPKAAEALPEYGCDNDTDAISTDQMNQADYFDEIEM